MSDSTMPRDDLDLPAYTFVPGGPFAHPGPSTWPPEAPPDPAHWRECRAYTRGVELYNRGFYWEAHEVWENPWRDCGRKGPIADFFKGLIQLAAAGVKVREGQVEGVRNHARRAGELFAHVRAATGLTELFGVCLPELEADAAEIARQPPAANGDRACPVEIVFPTLKLTAAR